MSRSERCAIGSASVDPYTAAIFTAGVAARSRASNAGNTGAPPVSIRLNPSSEAPALRSRSNNAGEAAVRTGLACRI